MHYLYAMKMLESSDIKNANAPTLKNTSKSSWTSYLTSVVIRHPSIVYKWTPLIVVGVPVVVSVWPWIPWIIGGYQAMRFTSYAMTYVGYAKEIRDVIKPE